MIEWLKKLELGDGTLGMIGWLIWLLVMYIFNGIIPDDPNSIHGQSKSLGGGIIMFLASMPVMYAVYKLFDKIRRKP